MSSTSRSPVTILLVLAALLTYAGFIKSAVAEVTGAPDNRSATVPVLDVNNPESLKKFQVLRWRDDTEAAGILDLPSLGSWSLGSSLAPAKKNTRVWLRFKLTNSGAAEFPIIVNFDEAFPEEANFYAREPDGSFTMIESGLQVPINERAI